MLNEKVFPQSKENVLEREHSVWGWERKTTKIIMVRGKMFLKDCLHDKPTLLIFDNLHENQSNNNTVIDISLLKPERLK